ncbi:hypothetical protein HBB16_07655 [Pseudonocardia sp. MCCB 268]|nr:hypothetical protein [Pseudonocardia cytotoxica]
MTLCEAVDQEVPGGRACSAGDPRWLATAAVAGSSGSPGWWRSARSRDRPGTEVLRHRPEHAVSRFHVCRYAVTMIFRPSTWRDDLSCICGTVVVAMMGTMRRKVPVPRHPARRRAVRLRREPCDGPDRSAAALFTARVPHVLIVPVPGCPDIHMDVEEALRLRGWPEATAPADADVAARGRECRPGAAREVIERLWQQVPAPWRAASRPATASPAEWQETLEAIPRPSRGPSTRDTRLCLCRRRPEPQDHHGTAAAAGGHEHGHNSSH